MWAWIIGFVVVCAVISVVIARRPGAGGDFSDERWRRDPHTGSHYPGGGLGGGGGDIDGGGGF